MKVETSVFGSTAVATVTGRVDSATAKDFGQALRAIVDQGVNALVIDCSGLKYMNSAGLHVLLVTIRKTDAEGVGFALCRVPDHILELLEVSGFVRVIRVYDTLDDARAGLSG